tara:strand:+ start:62639 stop:64720 length:2082 start_codon:yes stop_codon:yes gene_type:complete
MSSSYYRIYLNQIMHLSKTMVVKSSLVAESINRHFQMMGKPVDQANPQTWKYYMNLSGLYHSTDRMMRVTSMDTLETIDFTKEELTRHRATRDAYVYGSRYYKELVREFPDQENLILGILNPVDINKAIEAEDGTILHYDKKMVEVQEHTLMADIETWIKNFFLRWNVAGYSLVDEYYTAAMLGVMFSHLPNEILNARLERCHTNEVHSYHIREYLASFNGLDRYIPYMTLKQKLFLYRNIAYLQRNSGKKETFDILLQKMITERNLPLAAYEMFHNTTDIVEELKPEVEMRRIPLNDHPGDGSSNIRTIDDLLEKQYPIADGNIREKPEALVETRMLMENAQGNRLPTKTLESAILDTTDSVPFTQEEAILNHWIYLAGTDRFTAIVNVPNPTTGVSLPLTVKEAFLIYLYAFNKARDVEFLTIPPIWARNVIKTNPPTLDQLRDIVDTSLVDDSYINEMRKLQPPVGSYISVAGFRDFCYEVFKAQNAHRNIYAQQEDPDVSAMLEAINMHLYHDVKIDFGIGENYKDWLELRGFDILDLGVLDLDLLANNIVSAVMGEDVGISGSVLGDLQKNMLEVMSHLSSYSIHYLQSINNTSYRILDTATPKVHNRKSKAHTGRFIDINRDYTRDEMFKVHDRQTSSMNPIGPYNFEAVRNDQKIDIDLKQKVSIENSTREHIKIRIPSVGVDRIS